MLAAGDGVELLRRPLHWLLRRLLRRLLCRLLRWRLRWLLRSWGVRH